MQNYFKKFLISALLMLPLFLGFTQAAHALTFTDLITFNGSTGLAVTDSNGANPTTVLVPTWVHNITDNIGGNLISDITVINASLTVTYSGITGATSGELWRVGSTGNVTIGNLLNGVGSTLFNGLAATILSDIQADGILSLKLTELTNGTDQFTLLTSTLSGDYTVNNSNPGGGPVDPGPTNGPSSPEPVTGMLFISGLGMAELIRRRRSA